MTKYCGYTVIQGFDGNSARDVRRTFSDIVSAREAFAEAVATQKTGDVTLFGERPAQKAFDAATMFADEYMPDVLDYHGFDADSPQFDHKTGAFVYA